MSYENVTNPLKLVILALLRNFYLKSADPKQSEDDKPKCARFCNTVVIHAVGVLPVKRR